LSALDTVINIRPSITVRSDRLFEGDYQPDGGRWEDDGGSRYVPPGVVWVMEDRKNTRWPSYSTRDPEYQVSYIAVTDPETAAEARVALRENGYA